MLWETEVIDKTYQKYHGSFKLVNYVVMARNLDPLPGSQFRHQRVGPESEPLRLFQVENYICQVGYRLQIWFHAVLIRYMFMHAKQVPTSSQGHAFMSRLSSPQLTGLSKLWLNAPEGASTVHTRSHLKSLSLLPYQLPQGMFVSCSQTLKVS